MSDSEKSMQGALSHSLGRRWGWTGLGWEVTRGTRRGSGREWEAEREFAHVPFSVKYAVNCQYANEVRSLTHYCFKETKIYRV